MDVDQVTDKATDASLKEKNEDRRAIAVYAGTFDPITFGHIDVIERAAQVFDTLIIAVAYDTTKNPLFSLEERLKIAQEEIQALPARNIIVKAFRGLLIDFVVEQNSRLIVRGLRAVSDFEYEFQMSYINHKLNSRVQTVFFPATSHGHFISSSFVKEIARLGGNLKGMVSPNVENYLRRQMLLNKLADI